MTFLKIVDYGDFPHPKGLQRVNYAVAQRLERHFNSLRGRLARRFGGLPVYVGHPDDPDFQRQPGHADTRAHGWVQALEARPDGLYGRVKWAGTGRELVDNAHYKFLSPRWAMKHIAGDTYEPARLLSIGLTNTPNIPGEAIANEALADAPPPTSSTLGGREDSPNPPPQDPQPAANEGAEPPPVPQPAVSVPAHTPSSSFASPQPTAALPTSAVANEALIARRPCSLNLGERRDAFSRRAAIVDAVNARMADTGEDYTTAWSNLKRHRPDLF